MYTSFFLIATALSYVAATPAPQATTVPTGPFFLGSQCSTTSQCPDGSQCYASNYMLITRCGNALAPCTTDAQCAVNSCVSGFCQGPVAPTLPLGTPCYQSAQCANGASCYAVNSMLTPRCGNLQAQCTSNSQCAFNTCVGGFCSGAALSSSVTSASSSTPATATTSISASTKTGMTTVPASGTGSSTITASRNATVPTATRSPVPTFTGGADARLRASFGGAMIASAIALSIMFVI